MAMTAACLLYSLYLAMSGSAAEGGGAAALAEAARRARSSITWRARTSCWSSSSRPCETTTGSDENAGACMHGMQGAGEESYIP